MRKYINENILGCPKMSFGLFYTILWKISSDIFGQPSILEWQEMWENGRQRGRGEANLGTSIGARADWALVEHG